MKRRAVLIILAFLATPAGLLAAPNPKPIHYQCRVTDPAGQAVSGPVAVTFSLYGSLSGATALWTETHNLTATGGYVEADLGSVTPLPPGIFDRPALFLGVRAGSDPEMLPRHRIGGAWRARSAATVGGQRLQDGAGTITAVNQATVAVTITFPEPFASPPVVMPGVPEATVGGEYFRAARVADVTATGCVIHFRSLSGAPASGSAEFDWIAVGK